MRGSLERPPIVIRTARWKALLHLAVILLLAALLSPVARTHWQDNSSAWCVLAIFGALTIGALWELARPGRLVIGPQGFEQRDLWRTRRWSWSEARRFRPAQNRFYDFVGFEHVEQRDGTRRGGFGAIDGLNQDWEMPPPALAALLNQARARWLQSGGG